MKYDLGLFPSKTFKCIFIAAIFLILIFSSAIEFIASGLGVTFLLTFILECFLLLALRLKGINEAILKK